MKVILFFVAAAVSLLAAYKLLADRGGAISVIPSIDADGKVFARRVESHRQEKEKE